MRHGRMLLLLVAAVLCLWTVPAEAERGAYLFYYRADLARNLEDHVGERVRVTDEVVRVWEDAEGFDGYVRFDTRHFRCAVSQRSTESVLYLTSLFDEEDEPRASPRLATLWGRVARPEGRDFYGDVTGSGAGVATESIILICDEITRPRDRWYREIR